MLWLLYAASILCVWFENRWIVCAWPLDRPLWFSPANQSIFWVVRLLLTYGTLFGLWVRDDFKTAAIAFASYYVFNKLTFKTYFNREVQRTASRYAELSREEARGKNQQIDEAALAQEAFELGRATVVRNMKGGRF